MSGIHPLTLICPMRSNPQMQIDYTRQRNVFAEQTARTQCLIRMSHARNYALQLHRLPDHACLDLEQTREAMQFMMNEFFESNCRINSIRPKESPRGSFQRKRSAFKAYLFQSGYPNKSCPEALRYGLAEEDHSIVARYEEEVQTAQRVRNAAITDRIITVGLKIAAAWARSHRAATQ